MPLTTGTKLGPYEIVSPLGAGYQKRDFLLLSIQFLPFFESYRADPRFHSLLKRMNLA